MCELIIDNRESKLIDALNVLQVDFTVEQLPIGDIMVKNKQESVYLIERKTTSDLSMSIKDGRYREQKARMLNIGLKNCRLLYLIEGKLPLEGKVSNIPVTTLISSIINTQLRDNIKVYRTSNVNESALYIKIVFEKIRDNIELFFKENDKNTMTNEEYSKTLKPEKKKNMTSDVLFIKTLALIPMISDKISACILDKFHTLPSLIKAYDNLENETEKEKLLEDLTYDIKNEKTRRVGLKKSKTIYNYLYNK